MFQKVFPPMDKGVIAGFCGPPKFEKSGKVFFQELGYKTGLNLFRW